MIHVAFALSGVAGLVYEVLWSRYLSLFVGHGAYAQVLVLAVYLGGMGLGALAVAGRSRDLERPLLWYAGAEGLLALFGLAFHALFVLATEASYDVLFPAIASPSWSGSVRWAVAGLLILPQAVVLGTTFPLMAAGLVRNDPARPGGGVAYAYLLNTLGGAAGVLLAGFVLIGRFGLPGTSVAAALLNLVAAGLVVGAERGRASTALTGEAAPEDRERAPGAPAVLLTVAFGTAVASFAYEVGWIRMLSLVLGSATHSFELMLSAFILGLALGALLVRRRVDASPDPVGLLGRIQVLMGLAALASLPLYLASFDVMAGLVRTFAERPGGYAWFNVGRYGLGLFVMLPSTVLAGMTLPVVVGACMRAGAGERVIGQVYGINTLGSVLGVAAAGLIALPWLGLEGLIVAGAALDVALGLWLLERSGRWSGAGFHPLLRFTAVAVVCFAVVPSVVDFEPTLITSGVYRRGTLEGDGWRSLYYGDGRTATVSAHLGLADGVVVLATNGKPDASLGPRWRMEGRDTLTPIPVPAGRDETTQVLAPIVALAHRPDARNAANIGHGSGMTATALLTSRTLERIVTIEIEPLMVEGSLVFLPANGPAFADPRASYVFDDAKSYFSYRRERFDLIFAEPSNPWVSGTAGLFTKEFYQRLVPFMSDGAVFGQWLQIYELDDDLFLSVLGALHSVFPHYRAYLVGDSDVAVVASLAELPDPDWSVIENERFRLLAAGVPPFLGQHLEAELLFDSRLMAPLLRREPSPVNSDYRPYLDLGADRARFEQRTAAGIHALATGRVDLTRLAGPRPRPPLPFRMPPARGLAGSLLAERAAWLRSALEAGGGVAPEEYPEWQEDLLHLAAFQSVAGSDVGPSDWRAWTRDFVRAEGALHHGTAGWVDPRFYGFVLPLLERSAAPPEARAAVELLRSTSLGLWDDALSAASVLLAPVAAGEFWVPPDLLLDAVVLSAGRGGRADAALQALDVLGPVISAARRGAHVALMRAWAEGDPGGG